MGGGTSPPARRGVARGAHTCTRAASPSTWMRWARRNSEVRSGMVTAALSRSSSFPSASLPLPLPPPCSSCSASEPSAGAAPAAASSAGRARFLLLRSAAALLSTPLPDAAGAGRLAPAGPRLAKKSSRRSAAPPRAATSSSFYERCTAVSTHAQQCCIPLASRTSACRTGSACGRSARRA